MGDQKEYYDNKVHRVVFHYNINKLVFELIGSKQRNQTVFIETLYYTNTDDIVGKKVKNIQELGDDDFDQERKVEIFQKLGSKIGLSESDLASFIENEAYRFYEVVTEGPTSIVIAKEMEYLPNYKSLAS